MGPQARAALLETSGVITDPERLAGMFTVVRETLDALERIGEAVGDP